MIEFEVPGAAVSFGTKSTKFMRAGRWISGTRKTNAAADWQAEVRKAAAERWYCELIQGPVIVRVHCRFALPKSRWRKKKPRPASWKTTKPDGDKILRLVLDALEGVVYAHDAQVAIQTCEKVEAAQGEPSATRIYVAPLCLEVPSAETHVG